MCRRIVSFYAIIVVLSLITTLSDLSPPTVYQYIDSSSSNHHLYVVSSITKNMFSYHRLTSYHLHTTSECCFFYFAFTGARFPSFAKP